MLTFEVRQFETDALIRDVGVYAVHLSGSAHKWLGKRPLRHDTRQIKDNVENKPRHILYQQ
jgi:hypothetical protein